MPSSICDHDLCRRVVRQLRHPVDDERPRAPTAARPPGMGAPPPPTRARTPPARDRRRRGRGPGAQATARSACTQTSASKNAARSRRPIPTPSTTTSGHPAGTVTAPGRPRSSHSGGRNAMPAPRRSGASTPSVISADQSNIAWYQAMSSVCTTAAPGTRATIRSATVVFPLPLRPSTARIGGPLVTASRTSPRTSPTTSPRTSPTTSCRRPRRTSSMRRTRHGPKRGSPSGRCTGCSVPGVTSVP